MNEDSWNDIIVRSPLLDHHTSKHLSQAPSCVTMKYDHSEPEDGYIPMGSHSILATNDACSANVVQTLSTVGLGFQVLAESKANVTNGEGLSSMNDNIGCEVSVEDYGGTHCLKGSIGHLSNPQTNTSSQYSVAGAAVLDQVVLPQATVVDKITNSTKWQGVSSTQETHFSRLTGSSSTQRSVSTSHKQDDSFSQVNPSQKELSNLVRSQSQSLTTVEGTDLHSAPGTRVGIFGNHAFNSIRSNSEFSNSSSIVIRNALQKHNNDPKKAVQDLRVSKLLDMGIPNITEIDCERALSHCQQKTDRAAEWLLLISDDIKDKAQ